MLRLYLSGSIRNVRQSLRSVYFSSSSSAGSAGNNITGKSKDTKESTGVEQGMNWTETCHILPPDEKWVDESNPKTNTGKSEDSIPEYGNKPPGPEPTRFGDWQYKGRSTDF